MAWQTAPRRIRRTPARPVSPPLNPDKDDSSQTLRPVINFDKPGFPDSPSIVGPGY